MNGEPVLSLRCFPLVGEGREDEALDDDEGVAVDGILVGLLLVLLLCLGGPDDSSELCDLTFGNRNI